MKTILVILGTRPEAVKLAPVILELRKNNDYTVLVCNTEQQKELSNQTLSFFGIKADFNLDVMRPNQTLASVQSRILSTLSEVYENNKIDATIVQGDTMTVFCGALVSFYNKVPVFHVEAGLRSYNLFEPFPEEAMRQMTTRITDLHFAPTIKAKEALLKEGIAENKIFLTGNTVIDALLYIVTILLGLSVGATANAATFLNPKTLLIFALGICAFILATAGGVLIGKLMCWITKGKINPMIGAAGVSAVPMAARVVQKEGVREDPSNFLLMHAMGPNVAGVIGSAVAAGLLIMLLG